MECRRCRRGLARGPEGAAKAVRPGRSRPRIRVRDRTSGPPSGGHSVPGRRETSVREPANVLDDGRDLGVFEVERLREGGPRRARRAHDENAQHVTNDLFSSRRADLNRRPMGHEAFVSSLSAVVRPAHWTLANSGGVGLGPIAGRAVTTITHDRSWRRRWRTSCNPTQSSGRQVAFPKGLLSGQWHPDRDIEQECRGLPQGKQDWHGLGSRPTAVVDFASPYGSPG